ncbi:hypothetical protein [Alkalinema sp. FACHB-956]|uniref:hypothetical protein n=1 Tax=Alkalinema sp. FACHB-956 TaxID=2692768 RepID=UPI001683E2B7|nr:hypothetical protein [Alkalinema sp. FACHB-956]MBD2327228.1 hypothetical protein [Alkalinema sp. FACHB-956]
MNLTPLLNKALKSEELIDLFEYNDVSVVYKYDRHQECEEDEYRASIKSLGLEFLFDENQMLSTLFIYVTDQNGFSAAKPDEYGVSNFGSIALAQQYAEEKRMKFENGKARFRGEEREWIRFEYETYSVHYEFRDSILSLITLQRVPA